MQDHRALRSLFLAIIAVGVLHMAEQLLFGIEEYYMLRDVVARWHALFLPGWHDHASVLLITVVVTALSLVLFALMRGGRAPLVVAGVFGLLGVSEAHHWIESIAKGGYDPGLVSSVAYVWIGARLFAQARRQWRAAPARAALAA